MQHDGLPGNRFPLRDGCEGCKLGKQSVVT
jgi:hypothetical protein